MYYDNYVVYVLTVRDWGLGIGDWGLTNPQSPIPNPHYTIILINYSK